MSETKIVPEYPQDRTQGNLELAVVVPTFNEIDNIVRLIDAVQAALEGHAFETIVVDDDSPDGTADQVRKIAERNLRVRCIQRIGRRGLSSAFVEGALATAAPVVAAIDGDMQHDEKMLPMMLKTLGRVTSRSSSGPAIWRLVAQETGLKVASSYRRSQRRSPAASRESR